MDILNARDARRYLALAPRRSLIALAAEGVEMAATIAKRQGNERQSRNYRAAALILRRGARTA